MVDTSAQADLDPQEHSPALLHRAPRSHRVVPPDPGARVSPHTHRSPDNARRPARADPGRTPVAARSQSMENEEVPPGTDGGRGPGDFAGTDIHGGLARTNRAARFI